MSTDGPSDLPDEDTDRPPEDRPAREPADSRVPEPAKAETRSRQEYFEAINVNSASRQDILSFGAVMATRPAAERAKEFSSSERRIAEYLAVKGPAVVCIRRLWCLRAHGRCAR